MTMSKYQAQIKKDRKRLLDIKYDMEKQAKEIVKVKEQVNETDKKVEETKKEVISLGESVTSSKEEFAQSVNNINQKLDSLGNSIPSEMLMGELIAAMNDFRVFEKNQLVINTATLNKFYEHDKRIKALEESKGGKQT